MSSTTAQQHPHGEARNIISFSNNEIQFDEVKLSHLLLHPQVKDREIAVVSIVGAYRKGKSFFMDYCLRFMYAHFKSINKPENALSSPSTWIGDQNEPLVGFSWRSGSIRDTTGLSFWSDVFLYDPPNGGAPIAILLVDTQGLFDPETSSEENAKILTLSTLLSSALILNLNNVIQEDQLQYLQYTTEFATFASANERASKPFQKFMFLIRDWQNVDDFDFGVSGGRGYLEQMLQSKEGQSEELRSVREHIRASFEELLCCLMPYPGKRVATASDYDGRWSAMDEDFLAELRSLIEGFLSADKIVAKKVNGVTVTAGGFFEIIKDIVATFSTSPLMPKAKTLYELTVGRFLSQLVQQCFDNVYEKKLEGPQSTAAQVDATHASAVEATMAAFDGARKMGSGQDVQKYRQQLQAKMAVKEAEWRALWSTQIRRIEEERQRAVDAEQEAERIRQLEAERRRKEEEVRRQIAEREREIREEQEKLRRQQELIEEEQRRQREAQEAIERERQRQREIEAERQRLEAEARARAEREEEERRRLFKVDIKELGINFDVPKPNFHIPKPRCSVM